ncbi:MAG: dioxygenase [Rhodoferax sp.]|nr:dioxygenase [Rhodoferax sp.]
MTTTTAPVFFISHGAPTFALEPGQLGPQLQALGAQLNGVRAVLVVSPHWQTRGVAVSSTAAPETIHDFGGFPAKLYDLGYPAAGAPDIAVQTARLLSAAGFATAIDRRRGLDHGAWVPLFHLLPEAQIPVFQVSMPYDLNTEQALQLGRALAPLRAEGVLILASGSMTHNLGEFRRGVAAGDHYVQEFSHWVKTAVLANAVQPVLRYRSEAPHAERAHPTEDHFLPLLVALGAQVEGDAVQLIEGGIEHGMLSMDSFVWGMAQAS